MESATREALLMTCGMDSADSNGVTEGYMRDHGKRVNSMVLANSQIEKVKLGQANGKMERKPNGFPDKKEVYLYSQHLYNL